MKKVLFLLGFVVLVFLLFLGLNETSKFPLGIRDWKGQYRSGFEISSFQPCGSDEVWWATGNLEKIYSVIEPPATISNEVATVYVELKGSVGFEGNYGHLGVYNRQINVKDVYVIQAEIPKDCQ
jgi:hypothetical protein